MNQKEADVYIEHLYQVWKPRHISAFKLEFWGQSAADDYTGNVHGYIELKDRLEILIQRPHWSLLYRDELGHFVASVSMRLAGGAPYNRLPPIPRVLSEGEAEFITADGHITPHWLLTFRRNCWLCGINVDATDEEKSQWVQGYTYRQVREWNAVLTRGFFWIPKDSTVIKS